ncbi:hypothetical protein ACGFQG_11745 [Nocardia fluminea]|uniref:hypothetical protein n=1 Tax=Nocardia fluminea TaxID=134984 RepID=UPI00371F576E
MALTGAVVSACDSPLIPWQPGPRLDGVLASSVSGLCAADLVFSRPFRRLSLLHLLSSIQFF